MPRPWQVRQSEVLLDRPWLRVEQQRIALPQGGEIAEFHLCHEPEWATALPVLPDGRLVLVAQYRHGAGTVQWEFPGGNCDGDESPAETAIRELAEETGFKAAGPAQSLGTFLPNPARYRNRGHGFLVPVQPLPGQPEPDAHEALRVHLLSAAAIHQAISDGRIAHAMHVAWFYRYCLQDRPLNGE
ncbi:MAG: NUDIX hydrolase [Planctomycetota bacterium]